MAFRRVPTGTNCPECGRPEFLHIVTTPDFDGTENETSRRGPSCWQTACHRHQKLRP